MAARVATLLWPVSIVLLNDGDGSGRPATRAQTVQTLTLSDDATKVRNLRPVPLGEAVAPAGAAALEPPDLLLGEMGCPESTGHR